MLPGQVPISWQGFAAGVVAILLLPISAWILSWSRRIRFKDHTKRAPEQVSEGHEDFRGPDPSTGRITGAEYTTYRLRNVPQDCGEHDIKTHLQRTLRLSPETRIRVSSLAKSPYPRDDSNTATLTIPGWLGDSFKTRTKDEWELPPIAGNRHKSQEKTTMILDSHFRGFTPLQSSPDCKIDCIAMSGLAGHAFGSFKEKGGHYMWLRDSLAKDIRHMRILTYGYDSGIINSESVQTIRDLANRLQTAIKVIRSYSKVSPDSSPERPLVLIGHSMGGIIIKEALICMSEGERSDQANLKAICAMLLFGVPNQGIETEKLAAMADNGPNRYLIESLSRISDALRNQRDRFPQAFHFKDSPIYSFYETRLSRTVQKVNGHWKRKGELSLLVDPASATHSQPWDKVHRLEYAINRDHSEMVKFSRIDEDYRTVLHLLEESTLHCAKTIQRRFSPRDGMGTSNLPVSILRQRGDTICRKVAAWLDQSTENSAHHAVTPISWFTKTSEYCDWRSGTARSVLCYLDEKGSGKTGLLSQLLNSRCDGLGLDITKTILISPHCLENESNRAPNAAIIYSIICQAFALDPNGVEHIKAFLYRKIELRFTQQGSAMEGEIDEEDVNTFLDAIEKNAKDPLASVIESNFDLSNSRQLRGHHVHIEAHSARDPPAILTELMFFILHEAPDSPTFIVFDDLEGMNKETRNYLVQLACSRKEGLGIRFLMFLRPGEDICKLVEDVPRIDKASETKRRAHLFETNMASSTDITDCLDSLYFSDWQTRRSQLKMPRPRTSDWIFENESFCSWKQQGGILWITGKPGSGKSTFAHAIVDHLATVGNDGTRLVIANFFYSARVGKKAIGHEYMLQSILYQLLEQDHSLYRHYQEAYRSLFGDGLQNPMWRTAKLEKVFEKVVLDDDVTRRGKVCCVLDGLDEADHLGDVLRERDRHRTAIERVVSWLSGLAKRRTVASWMNLLVLSRPMREISLNLDYAWVITVENHNSPAIRIIVEHGLNDIKAEMVRQTKETTMTSVTVRDHVLDGAEQQLGPIRDYLLSSANGVILWVVVVLDLLHREVGKGYYSPKSLKSTANMLPRDLEGLYKEVIERLSRQGPEDWAPTARNMLSWVCMVKRPLSLAEFRDAILTGEIDTASPTANEHFEEGRIILSGDSWEPVKRAILDTCGSLIEVVAPPLSDQKSTSGKPLEVGADFRVQVAHQTVKSFLIWNHGAAGPLALDPSAAHLFIHEGLTRYLIVSLQLVESAEQPDSDLESLSARLQDRPLLSYAEEFLENQVVEAEKHPMMPLSAIAAQESPAPPGHWPTNDESHDSALVIYGASRSVQEPPSEFLLRLFITASDFGHHQTLRLLLLPKFRPPDFYIKQECLWAIRNENLAAAAVLLSAYRGSPAGMVDYSAFVTGELLRGARAGESPLLLETFLEHGADVLSCNEQGQMALHLSARKGHEDLVKLLLNYNGDSLNHKDRLGRSPLSWAAENGHKTIVVLLLDQACVDANTRDGKSRTPLVWAIEEEHYNVAETLLNHRDANVNLDDDKGRTPLSLAAEYGQERLVELILGRDDVDVDMSDYSGRTPLSWAAEQGQMAVIRRLLAHRDVDIQSRDFVGLTPLMWAMRRSHLAAAQLLAIQ